MVVSFLHALAASDVDTAVAPVTDDLVYMNVTRPTTHGRDRLERLARPMDASSCATPASPTGASPSTGSTSRSAP